MHTRIHTESTQTSWTTPRRRSVTVSRPTAASVRSRPLLRSNFVATSSRAVLSQRRARPAAMHGRTSKLGEPNIEFHLRPVSSCRNVQEQSLYDHQLTSAYGKNATIVPLEKTGAHIANYTPLTEEYYLYMPPHTIVAVNIIINPEKIH